MLKRIYSKKICHFLPSFKGSSYLAWNICFFCIKHTLITENMLGCVFCDKLLATTSQQTVPGLYTNIRTDAFISSVFILIKPNNWIVNVIHNCRYIYYLQASRFLLSAKLICVIKKKKSGYDLIILSSQRGPVCIYKNASTVLPQLTLQNVLSTSCVCSPFSSETFDYFGRIISLLPEE